eukprot:2157064-Rhodomonas_salina.1
MWGRAMQRALLAVAVIAGGGRGDARGHDLGVSPVHVPSRGYGWFFGRDNGEKIPASGALGWSECCFAPNFVTRAPFEEEMLFRTSIFAQICPVRQSLVLGNTRKPK